ncbi:MAG: hypothetical protein ACRCYV_01435, partial [Aeromonas sp.]
WFYNNHLPMRVLGHLSPIDAMQAWQKKRPELFIKSVRKSHNLAGRDNRGPIHDCSQEVSLHSR